MFPADYFPPAAFPPSYFAGTSNGPPTGGAGYFPGSYFGGSYFPGTYFPGSSGGTSPTPDLPATFPAAVLARLLGDAMLVAALRGGLWWREAPARRPGGGWPYGVYLIPADRYTDVSTRGDYLREGLLQLSFFDPSQDTARRIANRAVRLLTDADARGQFLFGEGRLLYLRPSNPASSSRPERGPGGTIVWQEIRQLSFIYQGNYGRS